MSIYRTAFRGAPHSLAAEFTDPDCPILFDGHETGLCVRDIMIVEPPTGRLLHHPPGILAERAMRKNLWLVALLATGHNLTPPVREEVEAALKAMTKAP